MAVIFPDIEKTLVSYFNTALPANGATGVRVGTVKAQPDETQPTKELVITVAYNAELDYVRKAASATIEVYADTYANANTLALLVESLVRGCVGEEIKMAEVRIGPVRLPEDSTQEKRSLDVGLIVKGTNL